MKLESKYDFRALRKAQSKVTRDFNRAAKAIEKLNLGEDANKTIEAILVAKYDVALQEASAGVSTGAAPAEAAPAESFV